MPCARAAVLLTLLVVLCAGVTASYGKMCGSIRMQNEIEDLRQLENCTIITGHLLILLTEKVADEHAWDNYSFPKLREIWDYLLVYRVHNLTTLGNLFPNLRVIKGEKTFHNHALVLFSVDNLKQIGLKSLQRIERGHVMIGNCQKLCYYNTIDWKFLGTELKTQNMTMKNCKSVTCPAECKGGCWSSTQCQNFDNYKPECILENGKCVDKCSKDKVLRPGNVCITKEECLQIDKHQWFVYNQTCMNKCPVGYDKINKTCKYCGDDCKIFCNSTDIVSTLSTVTSFSGCTHVNGSLHFKIDDDKVAEDLEKHMSGIKEISGYLKITRSPSIKSLEFLKNLHLIKGEILDDNTNSLIVVDNRNLNKLWTFDKNFKLKINNGNFSFHFNPQLRYKDIVKLNELTINMNFTTAQVSTESNGDQRSELDLKAETVIHPTNVTLTWKGLNNSSGFFLYYIEDEDLNGGEEDVCTSNAWNVVFASDNFVTLVDLKPFSNYSFYIVITRKNDKVQSKTKIHHFKTLSGDPSGPINVEAFSYNATAIKIIWEPPLEIRGILENYVITYYKIPTEWETLKTRNYCKHPITDGYLGIPIKEEWNPSKIFGKMLPNGNCDCPETSNIRRREITTGTEVIDLARFDQELMEILKINDKNGYAISSDSGGNMSQVSFGEHVVDADYNSTLITGLDHFSTYVFYVSACNQRRTEDKQCSGIVMVYNRTSALANADDISDFTVVESKSGIVKLNWTNPTMPNSAILSYRIHWRTESNSNKSVCVLPTEIGNDGYVLDLYDSGDYDIRVRAVTLAGLGNYTEFKRIYIGKPYDNDTVLVIGLTLLFFAVLACCGFAYYRYRKRKELENIHLIQNVNPDYCGAVYLEDEWEIDRDDVDIGSSLGKGTFGTVYGGYLKSRQMPCAVKTVNSSSTYEEKMKFLNEGSVMKAFNNAHHVVRLLGVVSKGESPFVIMELMACGDLKNFLRRSRDSSQSIGCNEMYRMAIEIADGMAYLAAKKYVHRDIAARNCMVAGDHTIKIGDFGMARDIYETDYYRKESQGLLPVRWMAPESLADGVFTSDSDIWSYGIVLWEMVTLAEQPYQGLGNAEVWQFVIARGRLDRPPECPDLLYEIMEVCWRWQPNKRPQFTDIVNKLEGHVSEDFKLLSFYHSREGQEYRLNARERPFNPPAMSQTTRGQNAFAHYHRSDENIDLFNDERNPISYPSNPNQRLNLLEDYAFEEEEMPGSNGYTSLSKTP